MSSDREELYPWLASLPERAKTQRLKHNTYVKARIGWHGLTSDEHRAEGPLLVTGTDFSDDTVDWSRCAHVDYARWTQDPYIQLREGDILVTKDGTIGKVAIVKDLPDLATLNSGVFVLRPLHQEYATRYLFWVLGSGLFFEFIRLISVGSTINHLYQKQINEFAFPIWPLPTQQAIADYLDEKTAAIDVLIEKKRKLLDLLAEERAALINQAVTKGLDPTVPMKDSGIPWIGEIPAHWSIVAVSWLSKVFNGATPSRSRPDYWEGTVPWLSSGKVNDWIITEPTALISEEGMRATGLTRALKGAIVIGMVGQGRTRGMAARLGIDTCINQNMAAIMPTSRLYAAYLHYALAQGYGPIREFGRGGQQDALNCELVGAIRIPFPPLDEQKAIASELELQGETHESWRSRVQLQIDRLQEYRQALITAAVTGQLAIEAAA